MTAVAGENVRVSFYSAILTATTVCSSSACSLLFSVSSVLKQMHSHGSVGVGIVLVLDLGWGFTVNEFTEEVYRRIFPFQAHQRSQYINPVAEPEPSFGRRFFDPRYRVPSAEPEPSFYFPQPEPFSSIPLPEPEPEPEPVVRKFGSGFVKQSLITTPNIIETPKPSPKILPFSAPSNNKPFFQENPKPLPPSPQELDEPLLDITPAFRSLEDNLFSEAGV